MPRKTTHTREDVVAAALAVLDREGYAAVTARSVADELGASTAPVYSNFASMEELLLEALREATEILLDYCRRPWTDESFLNMGVGYLRFAHERPQLFKALYYERHGDFDPDARVNEVLLGRLDEHPWLADLPRSIKAELLFQAGIYTHGLAVSICSGLWRDPDLDQTTQWLHNVGGLLVRAALEAAGQEPSADIELRFGQFTIPWRHSGGQATGEGHDV